MPPDPSIGLNLAALFLRVEIFLGPGGSGEVTTSPGASEDTDPEGWEKEPREGGVDTPVFTGTESPSDMEVSLLTGLSTLLLHLSSTLLIFFTLSTFLAPSILLTLSILILLLDCSLAGALTELPTLFKEFNLGASFARCEAELRAAFIAGASSAADAAGASAAEDETDGAFGSELSGCRDRTALLACFVADLVFPSERSTSSARGWSSSEVS